MELFDLNNKFENILPYDGVVNYHGRILKHEDSQKYFAEFLDNIEWKNDEAVIFGKYITTKRKAAWYGDNNFSYTYSNITKHALEWTHELTSLKQIIENECGHKFNSCLLNLYHNGNEGMSWHSDDERELGANTVIASLSLGAERKFSFKHKRTKETVLLTLENGSLLIMKGATQSNWLHSLPKTTKCAEPRINLTFRTIISA